MLHACSVGDRVRVGCGRKGWEGSGVGKGDRGMRRSRWATEEGDHGKGKAQDVKGKCLGCQDASGSKQVRMCRYREC